MKSAIFVVSTLFLAISCSGGDNGSEPECGSNSSCPSPQLNPDPSILGLWDRSGIHDSQQEILYTFIGAEGEYLVYDYQQDDFGSGENCHTLDSGTIYRNAESSNYILEFETIETDAAGTSMSSATIFLQGNNLEFRIPESGVEEIWTPVVELTVDDLDLCQ